MDDWVFESILDTLDGFRSSLDWWSHLWTWLVIAGVAFELLFIWLDHRSDWKAWHRSRTRGVLSMPEKPSRWILLWELLSVGLVVAGITGELIINIRSARLETFIREVNGLRVLMLQEEAGSAASSAERAQGSANAANISAGEAKKKADAVKKEADTIEFVFSARHVEDVEGLENDLRKEFKESHIVFTSYWDDEALPLCEQLVDIAKKAEVGPIDKCGDEPFIPGRAPEEDLVIEAPSGEDVRIRRIVGILVGPRRVQGPLASILGFRQSPQLGVLVGLQHRYWFASKWPYPYRKRPKNKAPAKQ